MCLKWKQQTHPTVFLFYIMAEAMEISVGEISYYQGPANFPFSFAKSNLYAGFSETFYATIADLIAIVGNYSFMVEIFGHEFLFRVVLSI